MTKSAVKIRTIFMGTSAFAARILESLLSADYNVVAVYTRSDKKSGREQNPQKSTVKELAEKNGLTVFQPESFSPADIEALKKQKPDLLIVAAYGRILPKSILSVPGFGAINIHASLLPKYRGPAPIQNAILNGEEKTGTTIMLMDEEVDTGAILAQKEIPIDKNMRADMLTKNVADISAELLLETLPLWVERKIEPTAQDESQASLCQLIERSDGKIIWNNDAKAIYDRYRAFYPWPGVYTFWEYEDHLLRLKLNNISYLGSNPEIKHSEGEVFQIGEGVGVQTGMGVILLKEVQLEGKSNTQINDFLNGYPQFIGSILK